MDLRDLRYFEVIAGHQHMGRASAQLHRTQPALTSAVRRLEADCGMPLFERAGRGIKLSPAGEVLLKWARRMRFDVDDAKRELRALQGGMTGQVRLGIVPTAAQFLLPSAARRLLHEAPEVTLRTVVGLVDTLRPLLRAGEIDLLVGTAVAVEKGMVSRAVAEDAIVVAASATHPLSKAARPTLKDLTRYRWALQPPGAPTRDWLDHTFDRRRLPRPDVQVESTMLLMLPALIAQTGLLSFISRHHLSGKRGAPLREIPLEEATMRRRMVVTYREGSYLAPAAERLISLLEESGAAE